MLFFINSLTGTHIPLDAFKSVIVILIYSGFYMFFTCVASTFSHKVVLVNSWPHCHGKHNTNNMSLVTFNSSRRLFNLISNAGAYVLCNMFASLFFVFHTARVLMLPRWRLLYSRQCFSYLVQGYENQWDKGGGAFHSKALGIVEVRGVYQLQPCPVTQDKSERSAGQSFLINLIYPRECGMEGLSPFKIVGSRLLTPAKSTIIIWSTWCWHNA